jgi:8-oxo-dGTP diphosphatase
LGSTRPKHTVTAAILSRGQKVLIARRPATDKLANKWEFPGGKVEDGETPEACLARELREELGIEARIGRFLGESCYHYEHGSIRLLAFQAYWDAGDFDPKVHDEIRWASLEELEHYDFAPADIPFVKKLINGDWGICMKNQ